MSSQNNTQLRTSPLEEALAEQAASLTPSAHQHMSAALERAGIQADILKLSCCFLLQQPVKPGNRMQIDAVFAEAGCEISVSVWQKVKMTGYPYAGQNKIVTQMTDAFRSAIPSMTARAAGCIPEAFEECTQKTADASGGLQLRIERKVPLRTWNGQSLTEVVQQTVREYQPQLEKQMTESISSYLSRQLKAYDTIPDGAVPCRDAACRIEISSAGRDALTVKCSVEATYGSAILSDSDTRTGSPIENDAQTMELDELQRFIRSSCKKLASAACSRIRKHLPDALLPVPARFFNGENADAATAADDTGSSAEESTAPLPSGLLELLIGGSTKISPEVSAESTYLMSHQSRFETVVPHDASLFCGLSGGSLFIGSGADLSRARTAHVSLGLPAGCGSVAAIADAAPVQAASLTGLWRLLNSFADCYAGAEFADVDKPASITFETSLCSIERAWPAHSYQVPVSTPEGTITAAEAAKWAEEAVKAINTSELDRAHEKEKQLEILSRQNPTVVAIIQRIWQNGRATVTETGQALSSSLLTKKDSLQYYFDTAAALMVPVRGEMEPVVKKRQVMGEYRRYMGYFPNSALSSDVVMSAVPGSFTEEDLPNLTAAGRDRWLLETAEHADTEEKQAAAVALLASGKIPRTAAADFFKYRRGNSRPLVTEMKAPPEK